MGLTRQNLKKYIFSTTVNDYYVQVLALVVIILAGFIYLGSGNLQNLEAPFQVGPCTLGQNFLMWSKIQGVSKKRNLFELEYLKDGFVKLIVLLVCYSALTYNSIKPNFSFL